MDDDQAFVMDLLTFIEEHDSVNYNSISIVEKTDDGRAAIVEFNLWTGDLFKLTVAELHE